MKINQKERVGGFTIIEVVLVLAIAGLIFMMVFIALPALQRGQRDTQRKNDVSRMMTQLQSYSSNNRGKIPTNAGFYTAGTGFIANYLSGAGSTTGANDYADPSSGTGYVASAAVLTNASAMGSLFYQTNRVCGTDGAPATSDGGFTATARNYVLQVKLEGQQTPYCVDNRG